METVITQQQLIDTMWQLCAQVQATIDRIDARLDAKDTQPKAAAAE